MMRFLPSVFITVLFCCGASRAAASRAYVPMGDHVRGAVVVALADTRPADTSREGTVLTLREIIKGDTALAGQEISLPTMRSTGEAALPREAEGFAVLLKENWRTEDRPILEVYQQSQEIEALRVLVEVYELPSERARFIVLQERMGETGSLLGRQLIHDLAGMREAGNFEILTDLFPKGDEVMQREIVNLIGRIGDLRGVPTLLAAIESPHPSVALEAARELTHTFRGGPGVTEAFRRVLQGEETRQHELLKGSAEWYLRAYDEALAAEFEASRNVYQRASALLQNRDHAGARPLFETILSDPTHTESMVRFNSDWIVRIIQEEPDQEEEILRTLLPVLTRYARDGNYLQAVSAAKLLGALRHPDCVPPLLDLMNHAGKSLFDGSTRIAAFALADRGAETRQQVVMLLKGREDRSVLQPLFGAFDDEGMSLITRLKRSLGGEAVGGEAWIIYRLGMLREKRATELLFRYLTDKPWSPGYATNEALIQIGGVEVEETAMQLLNHPDENWVRRQASEIVFRLQGARALPLARRMLSEADFGMKSSAASFLSRYGTFEDMDLLIPLSDFWTGDRENHYWVMSALSELRRRHHWDANGPIEIP